MSEKIREEFEAAVQLAFHQAGNVADLRKVKGQYVEAVHQSAWWGWRASRESLVIELPKIVDKEWANTNAERSAMREAIGWCKKRIEATGIKVKP